MLPRAKHHKRDHLKHPSHKEDPDQSWLRKFWLVIGFFVLLSGALVFYGTHNENSDVQPDTYVSVKSRTMVGKDQNAICQLSLLIDPEQESSLQGRQKELEAVVSSTLAEIYQNEQRPPLTEVRQRLLTAINEKLPGKLQIRDVLIQQLLIGS